VRVGVDFTLVDEALFVIVEELDGVLDRNHVLFAFGVNLVEHSGERRGLTGTRGARDKDEAARLIAKAANDIRKSQSVESFDFPRNGTEHSANRTALVENVAAETSEVFQAEGKVELKIRFEAMLLRVG